MTWITLLMNLGLLVLFYQMTVSRFRWLSLLGILLSFALVMVLVFRLGFMVGDHFHSCEPPPIEVYL
jgi:hypothetical protein